MSFLARCQSATRPLVIGAIHLLPTPGSGAALYPPPTIADLVHQAAAEASLYKAAGLDGVIVENTHDVPYVTETELGPEVVTAMTAACWEVKRVLEKEQQADQRMLLGVQVLAGANRAALAIAHASSADFIRAEAFTFAHVADEGLMNASAGGLLRYRQSIGAVGVAILADIQKKHCSHAITSDLDLAQLAKGTEFCRAEGLVVTGQSTGEPPSENDVIEVSRESAVRLPVFIGSGVSADNVRNYVRTGCAGLIVGSDFKDNGWRGQLSADRIRRFMDALRDANSRIGTQLQLSKK